MRSSALALVAVLATALPAAAAPIVAGSTTLPGRAIQDITLLPGTPFNPGPTPIVIDDLFGDGYLLLNRAAQVGTTIDVPTADGVFYGSLPGLGSYRFGRVGVLTTADFDVSITNVVQDPTDPGFAYGSPSSLQSGLYTLGGDSFGFEFLTGPLAGVILYTSAATPFQFQTALDGLPPTDGTVLANSGLDVVDVLFNGVKVGESSDRRIVLDSAFAIPEPASLALAAVGAAGLAVRLRRRAA